MAENDKYKDPIVLPEGVKVAFDTSIGEWTRADKIDPQNILKTNVLDNGYKQDDFKKAAQSQGLYGQEQPTIQPVENSTSQVVANQTSQSFVAGTNNQGAAPANTVTNVVTEAVTAVAEGVGTAVASDLQNTVKTGVEMVNEAQNLTESLFIPNNGN